jgi:uncharacterized protein involved in exopolysaccharide biosynthesis
MKKMFGITWKDFGMRTIFVISLSLFTLLLTDFGLSKLSQTFESSSLLVFKQPIFTNGVLIEHRTDEDLAQRISTLNNEVLSRSSLEPMIAKYALYNDEKAKGMPIEMIVEKMKRATTVEIDRSNIGFHQFRVSFRYSNAKKAQQVTNELASRYVSTQYGCNPSISNTRYFLEQQIKEAKNKLRNLKGQELNDAKAAYQSLLKKQTEQLETEKQVRLYQFFEVSETANLAEQPVSPNRLKLEAIGASFGFILGLMLVWFAGIIESRKPQLR